MKRYSTLFYYLLLAFLSITFIFLAQHIMGQTYVPVTNYHNGISIEIQGTQGADYVFDRYYFDPLINDCGLCYIKSDVDINLFHNENDSRVDPDLLPCVNSVIRYKVDRDWQKDIFWAGDDGEFGNASKKVYPAFPGPFSFNDMEYETGVPVVGNTGFVPGVDPTDRANYYNRGLLDLAGNEYHYFTYADDDDQCPDWKNLEMSASDGKSMLFCVNPKTPAIWMVATTASAQYYTTPAKVYWVPKIHEQTSYITNDVDIQLKNIMNSNTVYYRIDGGSYQAYTGAISSNTLSDGEHTLEFYYDPAYIQNRKIVKNPDHPSKSDVYVDGKSHGYLLWKNDAEFMRIKDRMLNGIWSQESAYTDYPWPTYKSQYVTPYLDSPGNEGSRTYGMGSSLGSVLAGMLEEDDDRIPYFKAAKRIILNNNRMHIENIGWELILSGDPNPSHELTYRGYYDDWLLFGNAFTYDLLVAYFRSDQYADGITPIEDYRLRDMLAVVNHETLMFFGAYKFSQSPDADPTPVDGMWTTAHQDAAICGALAMPGYNTTYYGACGFDGSTNNNQWAPYPDVPRTWKDVYLNIVDKDNPEQVELLNGFPNQANMFNWYDGTTTAGLVRVDGGWSDRGAYTSTSLMGHGFEIFYNVMRRKLNVTYDNLDSFMVKSAEGRLYSYFDDATSGNPRRLMANEYFPDMAPIVIDAQDEDMRAFYLTKPYFYLFHNPDWEDIAFCNSTTPSSVPFIITGTPTDKSVTLTWSASEHDECTITGYKIKRNGQVIALVNALTYTDTGLLPSSTYDYEISAIIYSGVESAYSSPHSVTTLADTFLPEVVNIPDTDSPISVAVEFNDLMDPVTAQDISNYTIDNGVVISSATLQTDNKTVVLTFSVLSQAQSTLTINGVKDLYGNYIASGTTATINYIGASTGTNVALGTTATANSESGYPVSNLLDGDISSRWSANGFPQTIEIDLGTNNLLSWIEIYPYLNVPYQYTIEGKEDGGNYYQLVDRSDNTQSLNVLTDEVSDVVRYLRITITGDYNSSATIASLFEVKAYGIFFEKVTGISLSESLIDLHILEKAYLYATISPSSATDQSVQWSTSNASVAIVDEAGIVTATGEGTCTITVTTVDGGYTANCIVNVDALTLITALEESMGTGELNPLDDYDDWDSGDNITFTSVADYPGRCKVVAEGGSEGYPGASGESCIEFFGGYSGGSYFVVGGINTEGLTSPYLSFGQKYPKDGYTVSVSTDGSNWTDLDLAGGTIVAGENYWEMLTLANIPASSDLQIKFFNPTRKAMYIDDIIVRGTITGGSVSVAGVNISETSLALLSGTTQTLNATVIPSNAANKTVTWSSDNTAVATVDQNGIVSALSDGQATITVTTNDGGFTATCDVTVATDVVLTEFYCDPVNGSMSNDGSQANPWSTLEDVFNAGKTFNEGDVINLLSGYHGDATVSGQNSGHVTIQAATGQQPTLKRVVFSNASYWTLCGLTISPEFATAYERITLLKIGDNQNIVVDSCEMYSVNDISSWLDTDWISNACIAVSIENDNNTIRNCTIRNISFGIGVERYADYNTIENNTIANFSADGMRLLGDYNTVTGNTIQDNYNVDDNHDDGMQSYSVDDNWVVGASTVYGNVFSRNTIIQTTDPSRPYQGSLQGIGNFDGMFEDWVVENNLIICDVYHGIAFYGAIHCKIINNTVIKITESSVNPWIRITAHKDGTPSSGNIVRNNLTTALSNDANIGDVDNNIVISYNDYSTYFADASNFDCQLISGSPAIDAGSSIEAPVIDIEGNTRPNGSGYDIGAYEYMGTNMPVTGVGVSPMSLSLVEGQTSGLSVTISPVDATNQNVVWSSNNTAIATVDATGVVSAQSAGQAIVTVTTNDGGYTATCDVTISTGTTVQGYVETFGTGTATDLNDYTGWDNGDPIVSFGESTYPETNQIANTLTSDGYEGASGGSYALVKPGYNGIAYFQIEGINTSQLSDITLRFGFAAESGTAVTGLTVLVSTDGTNWITLGDSTVTTTATEWSLMEFNYIPSAANLRVRFEESVRKAIYIDDLIIEGSGTSTIPVSSVSVNPTTLSLDEGQTSSLTMTILQASASDQSVAWSSSNEAVATVDASGLATAVSAGNAIITVTTNDGGFSASCDVTVIPSSGSTNIALGKPVAVSSEPQSENPASNITDGNTADDSRWSASSFPQWAEIDLGANYDVTSIEVFTYQARAYQYNIEAKPEGGAYSIVVDRSSNTDGSQPITDVVSTTARYLKINLTGASVYTGTWVSITEIQVYGTLATSIPTPVTGVSVNPQTLSLNEGETATLTETVSPADASDQSVIWSSSNEAVATVDASSFVTAVSAGSTVITVTTNDGGYNATCIVTVIAPVSGISVSPTSLTLDEGETATLTETITPANASDQSVTWSSSNEAIVTVDASGFVTAVTAGSAIIIATTNDGGFSSFCNVTVSAPVLLGILESVGTGTASTIAAYTGWDSELPILFSGGNEYPGVNEVESSNASDTYQGASGGSNVHIRTGYNGTGYFIVGGINTSGLANPVLTFGIMYNSVTGKDNFGVFVSTDGVNWTELTDGTFPALSTWGLMTYENIPSVGDLSVKFEVAARKDIWIDDISIENSIAKNKIENKRNTVLDEPELLVFPNPGNGENISIQVSGLIRNQKYSISICDITGKLIYADDEIFSQDMSIQSINLTNGIKPGVYFIKLNKSGVIRIEKLIIE